MGHEATGKLGSPESEFWIQAGLAGVTLGTEGWSFIVPLPASPESLALAWAAAPTNALRRGGSLVPRVEVTWPWW